MEDALDAENKRMADSLAGKVTRLKSVSGRAAAGAAGKEGPGTSDPGVGALGLLPACPRLLVEVVARMPLACGRPGTGS